MRQVTEILDFLDSPETDGYFSRSIPDPIDSKIRTLVEYVLRVDPATRTALAGKIKLGSARCLKAYAARMASLAVRTKDVSNLHDGFLALALGAKHLDPRDYIPTLAILADAGRKIGVEPSQWADDARHPVGDIEFAHVFSKTIDRTNYRLADMGWTEGEESGQFLYKPIF